MTVTAQLSATSASAVTVPFTITGTATNGTDYTITASPINIAAGSTTGTATITVTADTLDELNETVILTMGTPTNATLGTTTVHTATITDNDATPTVQWTAASQASANETGTMTVTAQLSAASGQTVTVPFTLTGTATSGTDYTITASPITITAGSTTGTATITITPDVSVEPNETVILTIGTPTNATAGATTVHTATITNDDVATPTVQWTTATQASAAESGTMTFTAQLSAATGSAVTVPYTLTGTATGGGTDYSITASPITIAAGNTTGSATITITTDVLVEGNETVIVTMGTPTNATQGATTVHTATITDDDVAANGTIAFSAATYSVNEAGGTATITARRTGGTTGIVGITYATSNGTATSGSDYTAVTNTLSWAAGDATDKTFTVTITNDVAQEVDETINLTLSAPTGGATLGAQSTAVLTIVDNDAPVTSPLMHNSTNTSTKYGIWGASYTCDTCHNRTTTNVKRIDQLVDTPKGPRTVVFTRMTAVRTDNAATGVFGNDNRTYALNASTNICEVCHHNTTYHQYSSSKILAGNKNHQSANNMDCTGCHAHSAGFKGGGHLFPYAGSTHMASAGTTPWATCSTGGCHNTSATGVTYATWAATLRGTAPNCTTCHIAGLRVPVGTSSCWDCHGASATDGRPVGTVFPDIAGAHSVTGHVNFACDACHTGAGTGTATHGNSNGVTKVRADTIVAFAAPNTSGTWSSGPLTCSATYCHSTVQNATGTATGVSDTAVAWNGAALNCTTSCHGNTAARLTTGTHTKHLDANHATFTCDTCHTGAGQSTPAQHANNQINVSMGTATYPGTYTNPAGIAGNGFTTCTATYCHSTVQSVNGAAAGTAVTVTWGGAVLGCNGCHGNDAASLLTGSHSRHLSTTSHGTYTCAFCHTGFDAGNNTSHVNKIVNVQQSLLVGSTGSYSDSAGAPANSVYGTCSASYCHSSAQSLTGGSPPSYQTVTWGQAPMTCSSCHGNTVATLLSGTHSKHLNAVYGYVCSDCHGTAGGAGNTTIHANQAINIDLVNRAGGAAWTYSGDSVPQSGAFGACNNTACHGKSSGTWGTSVSNQLCTECHGQANVAYGNFSAAIIAPGGAGVDTGGNTAATAPRVGAHQTHLLGSSNISAPIHCGECHFTHTTIQDATHLNFTTATVTYQNAVLAKAASHSPTATRVSGIYNCNNTYCHTGKLNTGTAMTPAWNNDVYLAATMTMTDCTKCHSMPPNPGVAGAHSGVVAAITTFSQIGSTCGGCHGATVNSSTPAFANIFKDKNLHIDGSTPVTANCDGCHGYQVGSWAAAPSVNLQGKGAHEVHVAYLTTKRNIVTLNPAVDLYNIDTVGQGGTWSNVCGVCHGNTTTNHQNSTLNVTMSAAYFFGVTGSATYNGVVTVSSATTPKTCSNISCHYFTTPIWSTY